MQFKRLFFLIALRVLQYFTLSVSTHVPWQNSFFLEGTSAPFSILICFIFCRVCSSFASLASMQEDTYFKTCEFQFIRFHNFVSINTMNSRPSQVELHHAVFVESFDDLKDLISAASEIPATL